MTVAENLFQKAKKKNLSIKTSKISKILEFEILEVYGYEYEYRKIPTNLDESQ